MPVFHGAAISRDHIWNNLYKGLIFSNSDPASHAQHNEGYQMKKVSVPSRLDSLCISVEHEILTHNRFSSVLALGTASSPGLPLQTISTRLVSPGSLLALPGIHHEAVHVLCKVEVNLLRLGCQADCPLVQACISVPNISARVPASALRSQL
jgi:hypothetical protein